MPREYRHIQEYEREIIELYEKGLTLREIGEKFSFTAKHLEDNFKLHNPFEVFSFNSLFNRIYYSAKT